MQAFTRLDGRAVPLSLANIDTDQIIPKQFLKTVEREGLAKGLFYDFRFDGEGNEIGDFVLNRPEYKGASVLIATNLKKNQALANFHFLMTDSTTHNPATGKTVTVTRCIDGGAFAAGTLSAVAEVSNGMYRVDFAAADLNGNVVTLRATATGCDDLFVSLTLEP